MDFLDITNHGRKANQMDLLRAIYGTATYVWGDMEDEFYIHILYKRDP